MGKLRHRAMKRLVPRAEERQRWDLNPDYRAAEPGLPGQPPVDESGRE